eukprot:2554339-Rhodomonas_salina.2
MAVKRAEEVEKACQRCPLRATCKGGTELLPREGPAQLCSLVLGVKVRRGGPGSGGLRERGAQMRQRRGRLRLVRAPPDAIPS